MNEHARPRVLVVDDSATMRAIVTDVIRDSAGFEVAGTAATGYEAIRCVHELDPDVLTLDLEMPDLGGLEALAYIMNESPRPVIMLSAHTAAGAAPTLRALELGALDYVLKPGPNEPRGLERMAERLTMALRAAAIARVRTLRPLEPQKRTRDVATAGDAEVGFVVAIAASTGGPRALMELLPRLPGGLRGAVIVVQHMPARFTSSFAARLDAVSPVPVEEATAGQALRAGRVALAPGGIHLVVRRQGRSLVLDTWDSPKVWGVRPSADVLLASVAAHIGPRSIAVIMTGMGRDGADGARRVREVGGRVIVQDESTSTVYGMPRAAASLAHEVLPLDRIADGIMAAAAAVEGTARGA